MKLFYNIYTTGSIDRMSDEEWVLGAGRKVTYSWYRTAQVVSCQSYSSITANCNLLRHHVTEQGVGRKMSLIKFKILLQLQLFVQAFNIREAREFINGVMIALFKQTITAVHLKESQSHGLYTGLYRELYS